MIWDKYLKCKSYLDEISLVNRTNECWDMCFDNQWNVGRNRTLNTGGVSLPFGNIIKPTVKDHTSTIAQNSFMPILRSDFADDDVMDALNKLLYNEWRIGKQRSRLWKIIKHGLIQGDSYQYCGTEDPKDDQIIPNTNVMFGDESNPNIQEQPYILIRGRELVTRIRQEAKEQGIKDYEINRIVGDSDKEFVIGDKSAKDVEEKCTYVIYLEKKDGIVHMGKSASGVDYYPLKPLANVRPGGEVISGMTLYPIANFIPEQFINSARGLSTVRAMIPNQIEINKIMYRRSASSAQVSFPKMVANSNAISNVEDIEKVGAVIFTNGSTESVKGAIDYILPASTSPDAANLQSELISLTRQLNGSSESLSGMTDPTRVAAKTVIALSDLSARPLNEAVDNCKLFVEDLARIWFDQKITYHPDGLVIGDVEIDIETLKKIDLEVEIDVTKENPWTREAEQAFLDNLFGTKDITLEEYVDASPDNGAVPKSKMKKLFMKRKEKEAEEAQAEAEAQQAELQQTEQSQQEVPNAPMPMQDPSTVGQIQP